MERHDNPFDLLDGDEEGDVAAIIKKVETAQVNNVPPPKPEKPKPSDESARGGKGDHGQGNGRPVLGPNAVNGNGVSRVYRGDFNGQSHGRGGGRGGRGQGFYEDRRFRNNDNYGGNGEGFKGKGSNFTERRQYSDENREFGQERRYGERGRGGYFGFRGGEGQRFNGTRNGTEGGLSRQGVNAGNAGAGWKKPETTEVAKDAEAGKEAKVAEVGKESAVQEISEDLSQKKGASENKEKERRERRKKEWEDDSEKMTLEEYWKVLEEKRKALEANKAAERKVLLDEEFDGMQLVDKKKKKEEDFVKGSEKEKLKKKNSLGKEEKIRKTLSIDEFLKPSDGQRYGRRSSIRGSSTDGEGRDRVEAHSIRPVQQVPVQVEDTRQFPQLGKVGKTAKV